MKPKTSNKNLSGVNNLGLDNSVNSVSKNQSSYLNTLSNKVGIHLRNEVNITNYLRIDSLNITYKSVPKSLDNKGKEDSIINDILNHSLTTIEDYQIRYAKKIINKMYLHSFYIYLQDELFGVLNLENRADKELISFKIDNLFLYSHSFMLYNEIKDFEEKFQLEFNNINYLELAWDTTNPIAYNFGQCYHMSNLIEFNKNPYYSFRSKFNINSFSNFQSFTIGNKKNSGKVIAIYNKTNEAQSSNKLSQLQHINFDLDNTEDKKEVNRVELRLSRKGLSRIEKKIITPIDLEYIFNSENQKQLFKYSIGNLFKISDLTTKYFDSKRNAKYDIIDLLPLSQIDNLKTFNYKIDREIEPSEFYRRTNSNRRKGIKADFDDYMFKGDSKYLNKVKEAVSNNILYKDFSSDYVDILNNWLTDYYGNHKLNPEIEFNIEYYIQQLRENYKKYKKEEDNYNYVTTSTAEEEKPKAVNKFSVENFNQMLNNFDNETPTEEGQNIINSAYQKYNSDRT